MDDVKYTLGVCKETLLFALSPWTFLLNPLFDPFLHAGSGGTARIVIVDAWVHKSPLHWFWRWYLVRKGFPTDILYFSLQDRSFEENAVLLQHYFEEHELRDVVIVAISSGALVSLSYLQHGGWDRVRHFISIGAPFRGTNAVVLLYHVKSLRALLPNSAYMWRLAQERIKHPERVTCLSAYADELVPRWSSGLPGVRREIIEVVGHDNLHSLSRATYDQVIRIVVGLSHARTEDGPVGK